MSSTPKADTDGSHLPAKPDKYGLVGRHLPRDASHPVSQALVSGLDTGRDPKQHRHGGKLSTRLRPAVHLPILTSPNQTEVYFPSITVFQRADWSSQAMIDIFGGTRRPKCGLHWLPPNGSVPACSSIQDAGTELCDCSTNWDAAVTEAFVWKNTTYRAITLHATEDMVCVTPTTKMVAEVFFSCRSQPLPPRTPLLPSQLC